MHRRRSVPGWTTTELLLLLIVHFPLVLGFNTIMHRYGVDKDYKIKPDSNLVIRNNMSVLKCASECSKRSSCCGAGYITDTLECHMSDDCCPATEVAKGWKVLKKEKRCENGWLEHCNYCYFVPGVLLSWEDAQNFCSRVNGFLIRIDSQAEYNWIVTELNKIPVSTAYVWLAAIRSNGLFVWRSVNGNDIPISTSFWSSGEPSGPANVADCVGIYINNALWDDIRCTGLYQFVCKRLIPDS